jgi:hypothetical protein
MAIDPFGSQGVSMGTSLDAYRAVGLKKIYVGFQNVQQGLTSLQAVLLERPLPQLLIGSLRLPDGSAGANLQLQFDPRSINKSGSPTTALTKDDGQFVLAMPKGAIVPNSGLNFVVHGANGNATLAVAAAQIAANGLVGTILVPIELEPLSVSVLAALTALGPPPLLPTDTPQMRPPLPQVTIGESGGPCTQTFSCAQTTDTFPFGMFFRLVEPQLSMVHQLEPLQLGEAAPPAPSESARTITPSAPSPAVPVYSDRVPIEQPLDADGFLQSIAGADSSGMFVAGETVPMAATLGLGYVLWMSQVWDFQGIGLGDLVYSLPLAPGEQVQMAVFERSDTAAVFESESFSESEAQSQLSLSDTSTRATFNSAFNESSSGTSSTGSHGTSASVGGVSLFGIGIISGSAGVNLSSGTSNQSLSGHRDSAQSAAEDTQSAAESAASARRSANRVGMRLASSTESQSATTKVLTNHNHASALTVQYWEVLRNYGVTTAIDGLTLACLVPMKMIRFMPAGQLLKLTDESQLQTRAQVLERYANIISHLDVLMRYVPSKFQNGLRTLEEFASDPSGAVDSGLGVAEVVIQFSLSGNFLPCESVSVVAVTRRGTRIGPVQLTASLNPPAPIPSNHFGSRNELLASLLAQRQAASQSTFSGRIALPPTLNRADIVGFEISRSWSAVFCSMSTVVPKPPEVVTLSPSDLEATLGGATVTYFAASIAELNGAGATLPVAPNETFANDPLSGCVLPLGPFRVPVLQIANLLRYSEMLEIEKAAQHIIRNTTSYSQVIWASLSDAERAILLDGYTIGVPPGGVSDPSQLVPLLNCIQNRLLGFFGNCMIMPFSIPQSVAETMNLDPEALQASLLAFQEATFEPPQSMISLPTRGVLGEAVLGHCPSAEKIDLTRFWNWQDSPSDSAPTIGPVSLPTTTSSIADGLTAPNSLTTVPSLVNNVLQAPTPSGSLAQALSAIGGGQQDFSTSLTGADDLEKLTQSSQSLANDARADALHSAQQLTAQAMATIANIVGGDKTKSTTVGSDAAAAVLGAKPKDDSKS